MQLWKKHILNKKYYEKDADNQASYWRKHGNSNHLTSYDPHKMAHSTRVPPFNSTSCVTAQQSVVVIFEKIRKNVNGGSCSG